MSHTEVLSLVIAISFGVFSIVGVMITLFLWTRGEANSDRRKGQDSMEDLKRDIGMLHKRINKMRIDR